MRSLLSNISTRSLNYEKIISEIETAIFRTNRIVITYINFNTLNLILSGKLPLIYFDQFNLVHLDGIGAYFGIRTIFHENYIIKRFTGSDFYPKLINVALQKEWSIFFFGDTPETLEKISIQNPNLRIAGYIPGYNYNTKEIIKIVNKIRPQIMIIGLGQPKQEKWIFENKDNLKVNAIIAVGDGIKVFAGTKKRGPKFIQKIGLEWFVRLLYEPKYLWKRYIIGIPLFIFRVIKEKIKMKRAV